LKLRLQAGGASVEIERPAGDGTPASITGYLLDARDVPGTMSALDISWDTAAPDFSVRVQAEASDDLSHWRRIAEGPVINLHFGGQQFVQQRIELPSVATKFLRLSWANQASPSGFTAVSAEPAATAIEVNRLSLTAPAVAVEGHAGEYLVDLGAHVPMDRLNLDLPELNTVATADFEARGEPMQPWNLIAHATLYRLRVSDGSELKNPPVRITASSARYWRVRVGRDGGGLGHGNPSFVGGWLPDELVFAARGSAPFELLFGNGAATPAAMPVSTLLSPGPGAGAGAGNPQLVVRNANLSVEFPIGGPDRLRPPRAERNLRVYFLWTVLVISVGLLGWMASRLLRELPGPKTP
jgi:hypothetical protein